MRKICLTLFAVVLLVCGCGKKTETAALEDGKIYFFYYNECPYCHDAIDHIDRQYPNLNMAMVNIHVGNGFELQSLRRKVQTRQQHRHPVVLHGRQIPHGLVRKQRPQV